VVSMAFRIYSGSQSARAFICFNCDICSLSFYDSTLNKDKKVIPFDFIQATPFW
jgi:hypothetical protein